MQWYIEPDSLEDWFLRSTANLHTRRARQIDLREFNATMEMSADDLLQLPQSEAVKLLADFRSRLVKQQTLSHSTVNRRLATLRALVRFGRNEGASRLDPDQLIGELPEQSAHVEWLDRDTCAALIALPDVATRRGIRDRALLYLLCEVPLLGWQVCALLSTDYQPESRTLFIPVSNDDAVEFLDDAAFQQAELSRHTSSVILSAETAECLCNYLCQGHLGDDQDSPLFRNLDRRPKHAGAALVPKSVLYVVKEYGKCIDIQALTTRTLRITAIMHALEDTNWNSTDVARRFPHLRFGTLEYYCGQRRMNSFKEEGV